MTTFVLVPGACHGGWWYAPLVEALAVREHRAVAVTLSGLDPDTVPAAGDTAGPPITLDTHVGETVAAVDAAAEAAKPSVVLVGHSYGGTVITAAADQRPDKIESERRQALLALSAGQRRLDWLEAPEGSATSP